MAATTLKAIIDRFQAVLEAAPLSLAPTKEPFSHDLSPNTVLDSAYRIKDDGLVRNQPVGANQFVRVDRLTVFIAKKLAFTAQTVAETMETLLNTIERQILADDAAHEYHASVEGRTITQPPNTDIAIASLTVLVDYDYSGT